MTQQSILGRVYNEVKQRGPCQQVDNMEGRLEDLAS